MTVESRYWTYGELLEQVEKECDLEGEIFVQPTEMLSYANQAVDAAEKIVKNTYPDYFLDREPLTLTAGTNTASLPSRIYAHKIRRITYRSGSELYTVERVKDWRKFEVYEDEQANDTGGSGYLRYFIINTTPGSPNILFTRNLVARDAAATVTCWFLRQANRLVSESDILDIPEAANSVMAYMKFKAFYKEGHPNVSLAIAQLNQEEASLQADLADMVPDADDTIEMDVSFYEEMS
jgi:hypothetical protein